jgi:hypothetical protein
MVVLMVVLVALMSVSCGKPIAQLMADDTGIGAKSLTNLRICTVGAVIQTQKGPIIGVFNQYAQYGKGQTSIQSINL